MPMKLSFHVLRNYPSAPYILRIVVAAAMFLLSSCGGGSNGDQPSLPETPTKGKVLLTQPLVEDIRNHAQSAYQQDIISSDNLDKAALRFYHLQPNIVWNQVTSQPMGLLTAFFPDEISARTQVSVDPASLEATGMQAAGNTVAFVNNAETTLSLDPLLSPMTFEYRWPINAAPFQWRDAMSLQMAIELKVPTAEFASNVAGYVQTVALLRDVRSGKFVWHVQSAYDSRPSHTLSDFLVIDGCSQCSGVPIIGALVNQESKYLSLCSSSATLASKSFSEFKKYSFLVSDTQFRLALQQLKRDFPVQMATHSLDPFDYQLFEVAVLNEIVRSAPGRALLASTFRNLTVSSVLQCQ